MTLSFSFKLQDVRTASPSKTGLLSTARRKFLTETVSTAIFKSVLQPKHLRVYPIYQFTLHRKCENTGFHESENPYSRIFYAVSICLKAFNLSKLLSTRPLESSL